MNNKLYGLLALLFISGNVLAVAWPAQVPATGETGGATGSNKGVAWPSLRFTVGSGVTADCVTDNLTGLMWPKNGIIGFEATNGGGPTPQPNYSNTTGNLNRIPWDQALTAVANMNTAPIKLCGYSDWRLPNKIELMSLLNYGQQQQAIWLNTQGFSNVQGAYYWSSSTYAQDTTKALTVLFTSPHILTTIKSNTSISVWPVRGGQ